MLIGRANHPVSGCVLEEREMKGVIGVCTIVLLTLPVTVSLAGPDDPVYMPDPNLLAAVQKALDITHIPTEAEMLDLIELRTGNNRGIKNLTGLASAKNLWLVDLLGNQISDLSPLSGMTSLTNLNLESNQIVDLSPLEGLPLRRLSLKHNQIEDISPLVAATEMMWLFLSGNQITDISAVSDMVDLRTLIAEQNSIYILGDLSRLARLTELRLDENQVESIAGFEWLTSLEVLNLRNNQVSDIEPLVGLARLKRLDLAGNPIVDTIHLAGLTDMEELELSSTGISSLLDLQNMKKLTHLFARENDLTSIAPIAGIESLQLLALDVNWDLFDISAMATMPNLMHLGLRSCAIQNIEALGTLSYLNDVDLAGNMVEDISPLTLLTRARWIRLDGNPLNKAAYCVHIPIILHNNPEINLQYYEMPAEYGPCAITVEIDIKPGSQPNTINLGSRGLIPVAILSSESFDATTVDAGTVSLSGAGVAVRGKGDRWMAHEEDVNGDGLIDLVVHIVTENLNPDDFQEGYAVLTGQTYDGYDINGKDQIVIVPPDKP
jgi:Leucine-rich repeat (LRR) protein